MGRAQKSAATILKELLEERQRFDEGSAQRKLALMKRLGRRRLASARELSQLHECLLFMRAYPDAPAVVEATEKLLGSFADRKDLRRFRKQLTDSGIAGTEIHYPFFWFTAQWLARRWPQLLRIDWPNFSNAPKLLEILHLLLPYSESPGLDELDYSPRAWLQTLKAEHETDAQFLIKRFERLRAGGFVREKVYEDLDAPLILAPGTDTPSRTAARFDTGPVRLQRRPLERRRPDLKKDVLCPPLRLRKLSPGQRRELVDLAKGAMVTRNRDLDVFAHADPTDVRLVDCGDGLEFAWFNALPERRLLLEVVNGYITLQNGVPIGYVLLSSLFRSSAVAYNVFETYRGGETAKVFGRILAMGYHLQGARSFSIDPYQLGYGNKEGLASGAWWFYYKLGLRPVDPEVRRVLRAELARMKRNPRHRSSAATLTQLASENMYLRLGPPNKNVLGRIDLGSIGLKITRTLADRYGADRERALEDCSAEAAELTGLRSLQSFSNGEKLAWSRWSPLIVSLPGIRRWSRANRRALVKVVRAKGGPRESDFTLLFDNHPRLARAVLELAESR